ncbi:MAG: 50S ribosome-binding GTPase, partial [Holosporaceae bacterium]|nr:50S ribosome-binding GTPase [Holosporaceae bacterium]
MKVAIIGRPNVGKSAIFNRLVGGSAAIIGDMPGITRDWKMAEAQLFGLRFQLIDTPGVDPFSKSSLALAMNRQSAAAVSQADVLLLVLDAQEGVTIQDREIAEWLRRTIQIVGHRPILLVKNKSEGRRSTDAVEVLGFGEGISFSAEHNLGMDGLWSLLQPLLDDHGDNAADDNARQPSQDSDPENILKVAVVGRPNVGKSTFINAILGDDHRLLTGPEAGITRDAVAL